MASSVKTPSWVKIFAPPLALLSLVYAAVMKVRAWFYHVGVFPSDSCGAFVLSIGNLQAGGTGKTPVTAYFARRWKEKVRLGIVSRGYGRTTTGSLQVLPAELDASSKYGDEPTWFATALGDVPVQVGERRLVAAQDLTAREGTALVLLDDGFQHMALRRSYDVVLLDISAPNWHWRVLPWGRLREPWSALKRADFVILTKTESASVEQLQDFETRVRRLAGLNRFTLDGKTERLPIVHFAQKISWETPIDGEALVLAAGLARPESFFEMVAKHTSKPRVVETLSFVDHHRFTSEDVLRLVALAKKAGVKRVLVTSKDAVKLRPLWNEASIELMIAELEVGPVRDLDEKQLERLDEVILGQVRGANRTRGKLPSREPSPVR